MSKAVLKAVSDGMAAIGMNYEYQEWTDDPVYPYFTGEYQEFEPLNEDGMQETSFILTGFTRGSYSDLEAAREKIEKKFNPISGYKVSTDDSVVAIFYALALSNIPTGDAELKKIQINLTIKEWKVI